jgi:DNA-binding transcriptional regulator YdaS (Cro superfamily)
MDIQTYLTENDISKAEFARKIGVSSDLVYQWIKGLRPVAIPHCKTIFAETKGIVTLQILRPNDWQKIWPELSQTEVAK